MERRSRSGGRAIKRARLTGRPVAGAVGGGGGDRWAPLVGGFSRLGKAKKGSVPSASVGYVNPFACAIPSVRRARPSDVVSFRRDRLHETSLPGLAHIVQWVRPARDVPSVGRGSNPVAGGGEDDSPPRTTRRRRPLAGARVVSGRDASSGAPRAASRVPHAGTRRSSRHRRATAGIRQADAARAGGPVDAVGGVARRGRRRSLRRRRAIAVLEGSRASRGTRRRGTRRARPRTTSFTSSSRRWRRRRRG